MDLSIQPQATVCFVSQQPFAEGQRVVSVLVRSAQTNEVLRRDMLETESGNFVAEGPLMCRWARVHKPRAANENPERELKLTAENLFMTLVDPATELTPETQRLVMFLALMLERKRVLRPKGKSADGTKNIYEHAKTKQIIQVPGDELTPEFFVQVQEQLSVLVGTGAPKAKSGDSDAAAKTAHPAATTTTPNADAPPNAEATPTAEAPDATVEPEAKTE